ncbi:MAG: hypothetical protein ACE365_02645 [Gammaproteobacteria bacterium]
MNLNIADCRNERLDQLLCQSKSNQSIISVVLPEVNNPLPGDIQLALQVYLFDSNTHQNEINIFVEINDWISKNESVLLLEHSKQLIEKFFIKYQCAAPKCRLYVLNGDNFININPIKSQTLS